MRRSFALPAIIIFLFLATFTLPIVHANESPTRILSIHYPEIARAGGLFTITVQVSYSARFGMMDVGVWDSDTGMVIESLVTNATLSGRGVGEYSFRVRAPQSPGIWHLTVITRAWVQDAWFNDGEGRFDFSVLIAENAFLILNGLQPNSTVSLDGRSIIANSSVVVMELELGTIHSLGVSELVQTGQERRYVFSGWSDGINSNPRSILLTENLSISPIYITEYLLTVNSDLGVVAGGGWYREGAVAQFGVPVTVQLSPSFFGMFTDSSRFMNWSGDSASGDPIGTIVMNEPRTVKAEWSHVSTNLNINGVASVFMVASTVLAFRAGYLMLRRQMRRHGKFGGIRLFAILSIIVFSTVTSALVSVSAQLPVPMNATVVNVGDASWYYWKQPASDTCILWLGGGVEYSQGGYLINPVEYESFGTIRFLQDLTRYYCLVALEKGPNSSPNMSNRTIFQELIQGEFSVAKQLHQWINAQGYSHIFLIGYSVGTDAAALIAASDPQEWNSSDGLILITAWLPPNVINGASSLRSNLMLLYGHAPRFEPTGLQFYQNAPSEGWHGAGYLHKEFHVLDQMGHEVWSPLKDNTYSPIALGITVGFIEASKALQFEQAFKENTRVDGNWTDLISQIQAPSSVKWGDPFYVYATVSINDKSRTLAAYDFSSGRVLSVKQITPSLSGGATRLVMPPIANASHSMFSLLVLEKEGNEWKVASDSYPIIVPATDEITLRVSGLVPNSDFVFDGIEHVIPSTGQVQFETSRGTHSFEVRRMIDEGNARYLFVQWDDANASTSRSLTLADDTFILAIYRTQYSVMIHSPFGLTRGSGWYDANSYVIPTVHSTISTQPASSFNFWTNGTDSFLTGDPVEVNSPMIIQAVWTQYAPPMQIDDPTIAWVTLAILTFSVLLILNVKLK